MSLNFDASIDPTAEVVISHPGYTGTDVADKFLAYKIVTPALSQNLAEGSRVVLTGNQIYSISQTIKMTDNNVTGLELPTERPFHTLACRSKRSRPLPGEICLHVIRTEPAVVGYHHVN